MVHTFILQNSHPCEQGGTGTSWSPLCSMKFMLSIITWNSKIPHMSLSRLTNKCTKYLLTLFSY